jgi:hypothetical protein
MYKSENTNTAEHTLINESTQTKLCTEIYLMNCQSYDLETGKHILYLEKCADYTHCVLFVPVIYIFLTGYLQF